MNLRIITLSILGTFLFFLILFWWSAYQYSVIIRSTDPVEPSLLVIDGEAKILRSDRAIILEKDESYRLKEDDIVETALQSKVIITWPDQSITRLGPETRITIKKMQVARDYGTIRIAYEMERGKVWNRVIRLLIGDSYFRVRLPKQNVVAGVRGTTFEINLDGGYIRAVDHTTEVSWSWGKKVVLFPGEIIESDNIEKQIDDAYIDATWNEWNTLGDQLYEESRKLKIQETLGKLSQRGKTPLSIDGLSWEIFRHIEGFEAIDIARSIEWGQESLLDKYSPEILLEYYQKLSTPSIPDARGMLRTKILEKMTENPYYAPLKKLLESASIWESLDAKKILPDTEKILETGTIFLKEGIEDITWVLDPEVFIQNYSGTLRDLLKY